MKYVVDIPIQTLVRKEEKRIIGLKYHKVYHLDRKMCLE